MHWVTRTIKRALKRGLGHRQQFYWNLLFRRVEANGFRESLLRLGVQKGSTVLVHSSMSEFGYIKGGAETILDALVAVLGEEGTIAMPTFPFSGPMASYLSQQQQVDLRTLPSRSGGLTEALRHRGGSFRSVHPSHPVCALGARAREIVFGHELTNSPCGAGSPFGRLAQMDAWVLRLGTGALTPWHYVQEEIDYPNLFLPEIVTRQCVSGTGETFEVTTRVYRERIPNCLFLGEDSGDQLRSVRGRDFPLLYSGKNEENYRADTRRRDVLEMLLNYRKQFARENEYRVGSIGTARCEFFPMRPYLELALNEGRRLLKAYAGRYDLSELERLNAAGLFPP